MESNQKSKQEIMPFIEKWKIRYLDLLIKALKPKGDVLEVGFRSSQAADKIEECQPKSHTIIEGNPKYLEMAKAWAKNHPNVKIISEDWEKALPKLGTFDAIFFNAYSEEGDLGFLNYLDPEELKEASQNIQSILGKFEKEFDSIDVNFTDEDIDNFFENHNVMNGNTMEEFFNKLFEKEYITEKQHKKIGEKLKAVESQQRRSDKGTEETNEGEEPTLLLRFLRICLSKNMHVGSRFTGFASGQLSLYGNQLFFNEIICNPSLNFQENLETVEQSDSNGVQLHKALVFTVEKVG